MKKKELVNTLSEINNDLGYCVVGRMRPNEMIDKLTMVHKDIEKLIDDIRKSGIIS